MKAAEMRQLSPEELVQRLGDSKDDLFRLRFQLISGQLQNHGRMKDTRREIARIMTIVRERELKSIQTSTAAEGASAEE